MSKCLECSHAEGADSLRGAPGMAAAGVTVCGGYKAGSSQEAERPAGRNGHKASSSHPFAVKLTSISSYYIALSSTVTYSRMAMDSFGF